MDGYTRLLYTIFNHPILKQRHCRGCGCEIEKSKLGLGYICNDCSRELYRIRQAKYYALNHKGVGDYQAEWRKLNPEKVSASMRKYYLQNQEKFLENHRRWRAENRREYNEMMRRRHHRRRGAMGSYTKGEWQQKLHEFNNCCAYCFQCLCGPTVDHVIPISKGGSNYIENIVPSCRSCNSKKNAKILT